MKQAIDRLKPGRKEKSEKDKVSQIAFYMPQKYIDDLGEKEVKKIALRAIAKELAKAGSYLDHKLLK